MAQLAGLTELCEYLSISTEESLMAFPTEQVVPLLVGDGEKGGEEGRGVVGSRSKSCRCWWVVEGLVVDSGSKLRRCWWVIEDRVVGSRGCVMAWKGTGVIGSTGPGGGLHNGTFFSFPTDVSSRVKLLLWKCGGCSELTNISAGVIPDCKRAACLGCAIACSRALPPHS